jgi:3-oxoacyl-[acyl-carrier-protein] synthase II
MLQRREASLMLAGATEACLDAISMNGFCRMRALSTAHNETPETASRPFDSSRDGFVLGEGAGELPGKTVSLHVWVFTHLYLMSNKTIIFVLHL